LDPLSHLLDHDHAEDDVMADSLAPGVRQVPAIAEVGVVSSRVVARAVSSHAGRLRTASRK
jgi:hypothetical protein